MLKRLFKRLRFFIVVYTANTEKGIITRQCNWVTADGSFVNKEQFIRFQTDKNIDPTEKWDIVITNIIEVSRRDGEDFNQKQ
jgi:hypothetical protein